MHDSGLWRGASPFQIAGFHRSIYHRLWPALCLSWISPAHAGSSITYQGQLQDSSGPVTDDSMAMSFALFDDESDGSQVGDTVSLTSINVVDGLFQVELDFGSVFDGSSLFLEVSVSGQPLTPRQPITPAPMAQFAMTPAGPEGPTGPEGPQGPEGPEGPQGPEGASPFDLVGEDAVYEQGSVGIGTDSPGALLDVRGSVTVGYSGNSAAGENSFSTGGESDLGNTANGGRSAVVGGEGNVAGKKPGHP